VTPPIAERLVLWEQMAALFPQYDVYRHKTDREIPVVVIEPPVHIRLVEARSTACRTVGAAGAAADRLPIVTVSLVLAEDSYIVREGIRLLLERDGASDVVAWAEDFDGLMAAVAEHRPDVVITDIRMPPTRTDEGIRAALQIRRQSPGTGVVVLSQYIEPEYALRLFSEGSAGLAYLLKERVGDMDQLGGAIAAVMAGRSAVDSLVVDSLVEARIAAGEDKLGRLSPREREVLEEVARGLSNAGIAERLFLSDRAVEKHINAIFTKLDLAPDLESNRRVRAVLAYLADQR